MKESLIYPGEYTPLYSVEPLLNYLARSEKDKSVEPLINMDEYAGHFKIEIAMPGVSRDQLIIYIHQNILSISVMNSEHAISEDKKTKMHEFDSEHFLRHISLPVNADTIFITAELRAGVLSVHIPKTNKNELFNFQQVIVY